MEIQKLTIQKLTIAGKKYEYPDTTALVGKINELVFAVNELKLSIKPILEERESGIKVYEEAQDMYDNKAADPYAEQLKWIGKLCRFWDGDEQMSHLCWGILYTITPTSPVPFCCSLGDGKTFDYEHCEPVKLDDDIIYKGSDNE